MANEYSALMLSHYVQIVFKKTLQLFPTSHSFRSKLNYMLSVLAFSHGETTEAKHLLLEFDRNDMVAYRTSAAHSLIGETELLGIEVMMNYTAALGRRYLEVLDENGINYKRGLAVHNVCDNQTDQMNNECTSNLSNMSITSLNRFSSTEETEELLLNLLLGEAQGGIRTQIKLTDLFLSISEIRSFDAKQRFRLGVGLAKLGLFDLSLRHVSLSATPWEAPLYNLRARLVFSPVHASIRSLALAIDTFVRQSESILMHTSTTSTLMIQICNSPNEAALALQALPLFHLAGFASPRAKTALGHLPHALPALLSEVFLKMCPQKSIDEIDKLRTKNASLESKLTIGIVSGSFDALPGKIVVGFLEKLREAWPHSQRPVIIMSMCFPTPRDSLTDRARDVFDKHINLSPVNQEQTVHRILEANPNFLLFADAGLDSRVFALAHYRLAPYQAALWGWGGTLGIPTLDFFFIPEVLWDTSLCPIGSNDDQFVRPQELYSEQVILLEGLPPLPKPLKGNEIARHEELLTVLMERYLIPSINSTHIYIFPGSVKNLHPEFDVVLSMLLKLDPIAYVVLAIPRIGRDSLPPTHPAVRHDLMHPSMPAAALAKLRSRLRSSITDNSCLERIRVLPPLDERMYRALIRASIAVFDPFPVGAHIPILESFLQGVPVVSAPNLQECTNSHADSLAKSLRIGPYHKDNESPPEFNSKFYDKTISWANTVEEYVVLAVRFQTDKQLRSFFTCDNSCDDRSRKSLSHGEQIMDFMKKLFQYDITFALRKNALNEEVHNS